MNDQTPAPGAEQKPLLYNYEIKALNGWGYKVASPFEPMAFFKLVKADGFVASDKFFMPWHAISSVEFIGMFDPNSGNVVQPVFGVKQLPQAEHKPTISELYALGVDII